MKLLKTGTLVTALRDYDVENISPKVIGKIRKEFVGNEAFTPALIAKSSRAAGVSPAHRDLNPKP